MRVMREIVQAADSERIFYFSDFIYFVQTISYNHGRAVDALLIRLLNLLVLFDRVLIPAEHLNINATDEQCAFKTKFLYHPIVQELIDRKRIFTTIWSACSDVVEHLDATERYMCNVGAVSTICPAITSQIKKLEVFRRNQAKQSQSSLEFAIRNGWRYGNSTDLLSYSDGKIFIPFSHESLLLGNGRERFQDKQSISAAKLAYINAMPSGNGGIYRSLVTEIELVMGESFSTETDRLPPAFFSQENYEALLQATGLNVPFCRVSLLNSYWVTKFYELAESKDFSVYRNKVFDALDSLSRQTEITNEKIAKERLKLIHFSRYTDIGAVAMRYYGKPLTMIPRLFEYLRGTPQEFFVSTRSGG
jgi:hypothetical protein